MTLQITALYAGILALLLVALSVQVSRRRISGKVGVGHVEDKSLLLAIRTQGNFTEYVPLALLLIGLAEFNGLPAWSVHAMGASLTVGRILHAIGLSRHAGTSLPRLLGTTLTWLVLLVSGIVLIYASLT